MLEKYAGQKGYWRIQYLIYHPLFTASILTIEIS